MGSGGHWKSVLSAKGAKQAAPVIQPFLRHKVQIICSSLPWTPIKVMDSLKDSLDEKPEFLHGCKRWAKSSLRETFVGANKRDMVHTWELRSAALAEFLHENPLYSLSNNNNFFFFFPLSLPSVGNLFFLVEGKGSINYCNTDKTWIASSFTNSKH